MIVTAILKNKPAEFLEYYYDIVKGRCGVVYSRTAIMPLPITSSAALASLAYLNAKANFTEDYRILYAVGTAIIKGSLQEKNDRLNFFYLLEDRAHDKKLSNAVALVFDNRQWTYKQLYDTSLKYGTWLKATYGVKPKEIVAIDFGNSEKFIFIWFGLWSIGAKAAFINYSLMGKSLAHCIRESTASLILIDPNVSSCVTDEVREELPGIRFVTLTPDLECTAMATIAVREPDSARAGDKLRSMSILIYTSGTTGMPKPAIISWAKCIRGMNIISKWIGVARSDTFYTCMPLYHSSASILGCLTTFNAGATLALGQRFSTKTFWQEVRASNTTIIQYVGETCRYLLAAPPQIGSNGENLDKQNKVRVAFGNGLRPDVWNKFKERFGIPIIAEFYSATEGNGASWNYSRNDFTKGAIGRHGAIFNLILRKIQAIVEIDWATARPWRDPKTGLCKKVAPGKPGELLYVVGVDDVERNFQGYFNNKKATEEKIVRDVLKKGDAYFRTGDVVVLDDEGRMYFSDRIGDTFRWKSENVSTNEVSESIGWHPSVLEANVYGVQLPHHDGRAGCVALTLAEEPSPRLMASLAEHVREHLPYFAVPLFIRITKDMKRTGTNKQQKHVLRSQGVDPAKMENDELYWLKDRCYVKFTENDWERLNKGGVKL